MAERIEDGFEYEGKFYRWHVSDLGKDLMLIDRFSGLPITEFFELIDDDHERTRAPILLSLIACSIRHGEPDWSVERLVRAVMSLELSALKFISGDDDDASADDGPLVDREPPPLSESLDESSNSTGNGSLLSSIPAAPLTFETSSGTPR